MLRVTGLTCSLGIMLFCGVMPVSAQKNTDSDEFSFGPPLRDNILFAYKYTERVWTWILDEQGRATDSSERTLIYYITQRQRPAKVGGGAHEIEANIDSMRLDYRGSGGDVEFNTQNSTHINDLGRIRHPAVLVPSALVSSVAHFTVSPYGALIGMRSPSFESLKQQAEDPTLDEFTYKRIDQMIDEKLLSTIFLPWRNVLPLGQIIQYDEQIEIPFIPALDRIAFKDSAQITLRRSDTDSTRPILEFSATFDDPLTEWVTYEEKPNPVLLNGAEGTMTGRLNLDQDGVVLSGFSTASGKAEGSARGKQVNAQFEHQVFIELMAMTNFPVN
ncbi:MAG: hypothetical protein J4G05_11330 [Chlorobi bacterium]|nr:hypothetical protein [Chlorobiota bacterium]